MSILVPSDTIQHFNKIVHINSEKRGKKPKVFAGWFGRSCYVRWPCFCFIVKINVHDFAPITCNQSVYFTNLNSIEFRIRTQNNRVEFLPCHLHINAILYIWYTHVYRDTFCLVCFKIYGTWETTENFVNIELLLWIIVESKKEIATLPSLPSFERI